MFVPNLKTVIFLALLFVLCIGSPLSSTCGDPSLGYKYDSEVRRCYKFHSRAKTYEDAVLACQAEEASLANPGDWFENMILMTKLIEHPRNAIEDATALDIMAVGVHKAPSGAWLTVDGHTPRHTNWLKGYPSNGDYAYMTSTGYWVSSSSQRVPFVCRKLPTTN